MTRPITPAFAALLTNTDAVVRREQALAHGWTRDAVAHAVRTGRWQRLLPSVYLVSSGQPTERQLWRAALAYGGVSAVLDGPTACWLHGLRYLSSDPSGGQVAIAVPHEVQRSSRGFVVVRRAVHPLPTVTIGGLPVLSVPHAVVAATVRMRWKGDVRALVAEALQRRRTTLDALSRAVEKAPRHGSGHLHAVLGEVRDGVRSAPEAAVRRLVLASDLLPMPLFNCRLHGPSGAWLADPDAYWEEAGLVHETDSAQWHLSPERWEATMRRHARMTAAGLLVVHSSPHRIRTEPAAVLAELEAAYRAGRALGPRAGIRATPHAA